MSNIKIKSIKILPELIGVELPPTFGGASGRAAEDLLEELGFPINRGSGCDLGDVEIKTRDTDAISAQTVATSTIQSIIEKEYKDSAIYKKFQKQLRIKTEENIIKSAEIYDFSPPFIQDLIEEAYNEGRKRIIQYYKDSNGCVDKIPNWVTGTKWGNFEHKNSNSWDFRIPNDRMEELEKMATSNFSSIFSYNNNSN